MLDQVSFQDSVPRQMSSQKEFEQIASVGNNAQVLMMVTLILPIFMKVFLSVGILFDLVFDMINMLQVIVNIQYLMPHEVIGGQFIGPANVAMFFDLLDSIVYFKPFENQLVKDFINKHANEKIKAIQDFIN